MGSIRVRKETGTLFIDYRIGKRRFREQTQYPDSAAGRKAAQKRLKKLEAEPTNPPAQHSPQADLSKQAIQAPSFHAFADIWFEECRIQWRKSYRITQRGALDKYLIPHFDHCPVSQITKADLLSFRSHLSTFPGRTGETLSPRRINAVMKPLRQLLQEAADRYSFVSPFRGIKPLKSRRSEVMPFSLPEVQAILAAARSDYWAYFVVRFFTGMRTGEVHGLKWKYVDFPRSQILVRESLVLGEDDDLKTEGSERDIQMSSLVRKALEMQVNATGTREYVFCNSVGGPLDNKNFVNRIWKPLLQKLALAPRRPYQMRHTAATLWLAAGEAPEWIARQLGHTTTEMLFRVYSRYVPNLTRQDGSAIDRILRSTFVENRSALARGDFEASSNVADFS